MQGEFSRGWPIVLCGLIGIAASSTNINIYTIGLLGPELSRAFGWKLSLIQAQLFPSTIGLVVALPIAGYLTDRLGPRPIAIGSAMLLGVGLLLNATLGGSLPYYYALSLATSIGGVGTLSVTWSRMVTLWFAERRGLALGIALLGTGIGGALLKPYAAVLVDHFGWRGAYVGLGLLPLLLTVPLCLLLFREPPERGPRATEASAHQTEGLSTAEALRDWRFWALGMSVVPIAATIGAMIGNMELMLQSMEFSHNQTILLTSCIGISVIVGRLLGGYLLDRVNPGAVAAVMICIMAAGCLLMTTAPLGFLGALAVIASVGLCSGVEYDAIAFLVARLFGLRAFSRIYSGVLMFFFLAGSSGPWLFARSRELNGSYNFALEAAAITLMFAAGLMLTVGFGRKPTFETGH